MKVAVVTGASSGIGWALSKELARRGYAVGLTARRVERLEALRSEIEAAGGRAAVAAADAERRDETIAAIKALARALGPVDLLVANAGVARSLRVREPNSEDYETMVRVNLLGPYHAVEAVLPSMLERKSGQLVAISSLAALNSYPFGQYGATKSGLSAWMESVRLDLRGTGIHCTIVEPGFIRTPMTAEIESPMPFLMDVEPAARRIARAIDRRQKLCRFPWPLALGSRLLRLLPDALRIRLTPS